MASYKTDESFLEKISLGAIGTQQVFSTLKQQGHQPIELERGSMNYKIWKKIKIKRIRVPDILCIDNGISIESRAKSKLEITMSHSTSDPDRGWDYGLKNNDYIALVVCEKVGERPIDWKANELIQFISIQDLREAEKLNKIVYVEPKGSQEGFETRITWPSGLASAEGIVTEIDRIIKYKTIGGRTNYIQLFKKGQVLMPLVNIGETVVPFQIIASVVKTSRTIPSKKVDVDLFLNNLFSLSLSERYAAAKALSYFNNRRVINTLLDKLKETDEHIYVKLEVAASLARLGQNEGYNFIKTCLNDSYLQNVLESVIVLAEIKSDIACKILCKILLDDSYNSEIRGGAAWGLGEQQNKSALNVLVNIFNTVENYVKIEAARALAKLTADYSSDIIQKFINSTPLEKPGIAWALSKSNSLNIDKLLNNTMDLDTRHWVAFIIGMQKPEKFITKIEKIKNNDPEVYFAVTLLWKILTSWIHNLNEY